MNFIRADHISTDGLTPAEIKRLEAELSDYQISWSNDSTGKVFVNTTQMSKAASKTTCKGFTEQLNSDSYQSLSKSLVEQVQIVEKQIKLIDVKEAKWNSALSKVKEHATAAETRVKLDVGGQIFATTKQVCTSKILTVN